MLLREKIVEVWSGFCIPTSVVSNTYDDEGANSLFRGKTFSESAGEDLSRKTNTLSFLIDEAFAYYLGSFLLYAADRNHNFMEVVGAIQDHVTAPKGDVNRPSYRRRVGTLSDSQRECVILLLLEVSKEGFIDEKDVAIESLQKL